MAAPNLFVNLVLLAACRLSAATGVADAQESATDILGAMYWTHRDTGVYRAARDGSEIKQLLAIKNPDGLAVDRKAQKLYFTVSNYPAANADKICRMNLDGSGFEEFVTGLNFTGDLVLDPESAKLYLTSVGSGTIFEIDIDFTRPQMLTTPPTRWHLFDAVAAGRPLEQMTAGHYLMKNAWSVARRCVESVV